MSNDVESHLPASDRRVLELTREEYARIVALQPEACRLRFPRWDAAFSCNAHDTWYAERPGPTTRFAPETSVRGESHVLDAIARALRANDARGGRFYLLPDGAYVKAPFGMVRLVAFAYREPRLDSVAALAPNDDATAIEPAEA